MSEEFKAGSLLFKRVGVFNEAFVLYENTVEPGFFEGFSDTVEKFANQSSDKWRGSFELDDIHLALNKWVREDVVIARFQIDHIDGENDCWIALFCGQGFAGGSAGFSFCVEHKALGGTKKIWNTYLQKSTNIINYLDSIGFKNVGDGTFFLRVVFDSEKLASSFEEFGKFENDDAFKPLDEALLKIKEAAPHFDNLINGFVAQLS